MPLVMIPFMAWLMPVFNALNRAGSSGGGFITLSGDTPATLSTFTGFATEILTWFITSMKTVLNFLIANPIALWSIIVGMIVAVIGMIFNILRGH